MDRSESMRFATFEPIVSRETKKTAHKLATLVLLIALSLLATVERSVINGLHLHLDSRAYVACAPFVAAD